MSDMFTPQVRALLDRLEPPPLPADFADRVVARAEALPALPPLPPLRKPRLRRRFALAVAAVGLVGVAAAAAVVPADVWRTIPVIGEIVELLAPERNERAPAAARSEPEPVVPEVTEQAAPEAAPAAEPEIRTASEPNEALSLVAERAVEPAPRAEPAPAAVQPEPVERTRDTLSPPVRETRVAEPPAETRETAAVADTRTEPAPERIRPADTGETRQQIRERTTATRQVTRERQERRERTERRTSR